MALRGPRPAAPRGRRGRCSLLALTFHSVLSTLQEVLLLRAGPLPLPTDARVSETVSGELGASSGPGGPGVGTLQASSFRLAPRPAGGQ